MSTSLIRHPHLLSFFSIGVAFFQPSSATVAENAAKARYLSDPRFQALKRIHLEFLLRESQCQVRFLSHRHYCHHRLHYYCLRCTHSGRKARWPTYDYLRGLDFDCAGVGATSQTLKLVSHDCHDFCGLHHTCCDKSIRQILGCQCYLLLSTTYLISLYGTDLVGSWTMTDCD